MRQPAAVLCTERQADGLQGRRYQDRSVAGPQQGGGDGEKKGKKEIEQKTAMGDGAS